MRVSYLYDLPLPSRFAAAIQILNTCRELAELGVPTTVHTGPLTTGNAERCLAFYGLSPHENLSLRASFPGRPGLTGGPRLGRVRRALASAEGDGGGTHVILSRGETGVAVLPLLRRLRLGCDVRFVYEAHRLCFAHEAERRSGQAWRECDVLSWRVERLKCRERTAAEQADGIICLSEGVREALAKSFRLTRPVLVLPSGAPAALHAGADPAPRCGRAVGADGRDIDVLYVGKLEARKGLALLITSMRRLPGRRLCIVGGERAEIEACRALAGRAGVADRIEFTGYIEPPRVRAYLERARVGVCPLPTGLSATSERFTSPLKILEMMAYGVPVVATDLPSIREVVGCAGAALLVRPDDPDALADGIRAILDHPGLADRLRKGGRRHAAAFSWSRRAARLLGFLEAVAAGPLASTVSRGAHEAG